MLAATLRYAARLKQPKYLIVRFQIVSPQSRLRPDFGGFERVP